MLAWVSRLVFFVAGTFSARTYALDFVRNYIRRLVRERLQTVLIITAIQFALLAATAYGVHRLGNPLGGRLLGSALVWVLIAYNVIRFFTSTVPDIVEARRHLSGPWGYVVRDLLGISIAKALVEMELFVLAVCLIMGLYVGFGAGMTFHVLESWTLVVRRGM